MILVSYKITGDQHDAEHEQAYHEQVQLFGDDRSEGGLSNCSLVLMELFQM